MTLTQNELRLQKIRGIGPKSFASILAIAETLSISLDEVFKMSAVEIKKTFKLPKNVSEAIASLAEITAVKTADLAKPTPEIVILHPDMALYPYRLEPILGEKAPRTMYAKGNLDLLNLPSVGFCGSRNVTEKGISVTADTAAQIVELGWVVVSGHARGVDITAHRVALENGGATIIVAAEGIEGFKLRQELRKFVKTEQLLIVSEFPPTAGWSVGNAMKRNKTIIGLSDAMTLVEARLEGGTFEAGKEAQKLKVPLFVAQYQIPGENISGNEYFLQKGATALLKARETGKARIDALREIVEKAHINLQKSDNEKVTQLDLFQPKMLLPENG